MASRYSLTVQLAPSSVYPPSAGHAAVAVNTPTTQTYAGFGPGEKWLRNLGGKVDIHAIPSDNLNQSSNYELPKDYSNVRSHSSYRTFSLPVSQAQAEAANAEIEKIRLENPDYGNPTVCTSIVNRVMRAAGLGISPLYTLPDQSIQYLSDIENAQRNSHANTALPQFGNEMEIPDALRDVQQDYAQLGAGYDTPSERVRRPENVDPLAAAHGRVSPTPEWPKLPGPPIPKVPSYDEYMKLIGWGSPVPDAGVTDAPSAPPPDTSAPDGGWFARMMMEADPDDPTPFRPQPFTQPWTLQRR